MHSHKTLALLALAASTASPALSAPVLEGQQQTRASAAAAGGITDILKTIGTGLAFGALPAVLQDALGGNSTRRDTPHIIVDGLPVPFGPIVVPSDPAPTPLVPIANRIPAPPAIPVPDDLNDLDQRGIGSVIGDLLDSASTSGTIGKVIGDGLLGGVASAAGAVGAGSLLNLTRREPSPLSLSDLSGIGKTILGAGASLATADAVTSLFDQRDADLIRVLQLVRRDLDERAGLGSAFSSILNAVKTTDPIGTVIGNGLLGGVASGAGALGLNALLGNTRRDDLISALNVVARRLAELD